MLINNDSVNTVWPQGIFSNQGNLYYVIFTTSPRLQPRYHRLPLLFDFLGEQVMSPSQ